MCSRNQSWNTLDECPFLTHLYPSLLRTQTDGHVYEIYLGFDDDDAFFLTTQEKLKELGFRWKVLVGCQHAPALAWNQLAEWAVSEECDYLYQLGDDVVLETPNWTDTFIAKLQANENRGVVGPIHKSNYDMRISIGKSPVIENAFVHRIHVERNGTFFPPTIPNWYCDDWITQLYNDSLSFLFLDIYVKNTLVDVRYTMIRYMDITIELKASRRKCLRGCFSFCLYGPYTDKYYKGFHENLKLIHTHFPLNDIKVYISPEAYEFVHIMKCTYPKLDVIETYKFGPANTIERFRPICDSSYDYVCIRDTDSRIHERDRWCIDTFLHEPQQAYTIRDHPAHGYLIMAGLWGWKRPSFPVAAMDQYTNTNTYGMDANFLNSHILPLIEKSFIGFSYRADGIFPTQHERVIQIPMPIQNDEFCGSVVLYDADGNAYHEFKHTFV